MKNKLFIYNKDSKKVLLYINDSLAGEGDAYIIRELLTPIFQ